ncbi:MAG: ComEA family DNA-binding protein [Peptococcaceae bacterium]|nr:ComEA family DNA-binding protein [Peptococcaceae bacterium]
MHQLQRIGLFGITAVLLVGFWAGLWYQGQRKGNVLILAAENSGVSGEEGGRGADEHVGVPSGAEAGSGAGVGSWTGAGSPSGMGAGTTLGADWQWDDGSWGYQDGSGTTARGSGTAAGGSGTVAESLGERPEGLSDRDWLAAQYSRSGTFAVHVVGRVASPGLYFMPPGSRIYDAVMEAEPEEDANLDLINMALPVEDGMQIRVPIIGRPSPWDGEALILRSSDRQENVDSGAGSGSSAGTGKININKATAKELEALPGIGPAYSQRIVQYREQNGGFKSIEDLQKVSGIGPAKMNALRDLICV